MVNMPFQLLVQFRQTAICVVERWNKIRSLAASCGSQDALAGDRS
jgi:hypothetical protein